MNKKHIYQLLSTLNVTKELQETFITALEDDNSTFEVAPLLETYKKNIEEVVKNDATFINTIKNAEKGRLLDDIDKKIKSKFNLSGDEIKGKTTDELIEIAKTKTTSKPEIEKLEKDLMETRNKVKEYEEIVIPQKEKEKDIFVSEFTKGQKLKEKIFAMPIRDDIDKSFILPAIESYLHSEYDIKMTDKGLDVFVKGSELRPVSKDGTKPLTLDEILEGRLREGKLWKESNGGTPPPPNPNNPNPPNKGNQNKNPYLQNAQRNLEEMKKAFDKKA